MKTIQRGSTISIAIILFALVIIGGSAMQFLSKMPVGIDTKGKTGDISENVDEVRDAKVRASQVASRTGGAEPVITAPYSEILEPGKPLTIVFAPVKGASKYEVSIVKPAWIDKERSLISGSEVDTLLKEITSDTTHTVIVPSSDAYHTSETSYHGEKLIVKALDAQGGVLNTVRKIYPGTPMEHVSQGPAVSERQIKILALPNQPELLNADRYVLGSEGGIITLTFGALPTPFKKRVVTLVGHYNLNVNIDAEKMLWDTKGSLTFGPEAFEKTLIVGRNPFTDRDTAFSLMVQYFDNEGKEINSRSINDESWLSIKIKK